MNRVFLKQRLKTVWWGLAIAVLVLTVVFPAVAQTASPAGNQVDGYPVMLGGTEVFRVKQGIPGVVSAMERANIISQRLGDVVKDPSFTPDMIQAEAADGEVVINAGDSVLFTVRDVDAQAVGKSPDVLAESAVQLLRTELGRYKDERSLRRQAIGVGLAIASTLALLMALRVQQQVTSRWLHRIKLAREADTLDLRVQGFQLFGSNSTSYLLDGLVRLLSLILVLGCFYLYLPFVLSQFPTTRPFGNRIFSDIGNQVQSLATGFASYLPNLIIIVLIGFLTYYITGFARLVIIELGRDNAYPWFYPEWVRPTIRLATFLIIAIAAVVAAPYLPGFGSPAFQGVSLFVGALFTLGSSSAVTNAISGIILIYTRAFRIGDFIRLGDVIGEVSEKSLFVTRIITPKFEVITIPNAKVLGNDVINYSAIARQSKHELVLYSTITLGYDIPWRYVHETLIKAAEATQFILPDPKPFVLQKGLNDYNVSYEINAHTDRPDLMPIIYSDLHQNIQDYCNQAGIEILSPAYSSLRDGNHSTIPASYLPSDYQAPGFQVRRQTEDNAQR